MVGARFITSKKGTEAIEVAFEFDCNGTRERLSWQGWLSDKAIDNTMDTLKDVLGYNGSADTDANGVFTDPKAFDRTRECKLVIELDTNPETNKTYPKIIWVNTLGGSGYVGVKPEAIKSKLTAAYLASCQRSPSALSSAAPEKQEHLPF
jgi:hypothetical protein